MPLILTGIIELTGEHGTGKTTAALECGATPEKIRLYDDDIKGRSTVRQLKEMAHLEINYIDAMEMRTSCKRPYEYYEKIKAHLSTIKPCEFDVVIFDTWSEIQKACRSYADKYPEKFADPLPRRDGKVSYFSGDSTMVNGQISKIGRTLEAELINGLEQKVKAIYLINHLKDYYVNNVKVEGKQIPDDGRLLETVAAMRVWYRSNPKSAVPISLFLKRPSIKGWDAELGRISTINPFPLKIVPAQSDTSVWDAYFRYIQNPIGNRQPTTDETPTAYELSIIQGTLTPDQINIYKASAALATQQFEQENAENAIFGNQPQPITDERHIKALELKSLNTPIPLIAQQTGLTMPELAQILK